MNVIVLGDGMVGVTTAYYLFEDGHEGTLIERRPGVARACSHANGGFVAIAGRCTAAIVRATDSGDTSSRRTMERRQLLW